MMFSQDTCEGTTLEQLMSTPLTRLSYYSDIIKQLLELQTAKIREEKNNNNNNNLNSGNELTGVDQSNNPEHYLEQLQELYDSLQALSNNFQLQLKQNEEFNELLYYSNLFDRNDNRFIHFVSENRKLLKHGIINKKYSASSFQLFNMKEYHFFLCSDIFFYASEMGITGNNKEKKKDSLSSSSSSSSLLSSSSSSSSPLFKMKHLWYLNSMDVDIHEPSTSGSDKVKKTSGKNANEIWYVWNKSGRVLVLQCNNQQERDEWVDTVRKAIQTEKDKEKK